MVFSQEKRGGRGAFFMRGVGLSVFGLDVFPRGLGRGGDGDHLYGAYHYLAQDAVCLFYLLRDIADAHFSRLFFLYDGAEKDVSKPSSQKHLSVAVGHLVGQSKDDQRKAFIGPRD